MAAPYGICPMISPPSTLIDPKRLSALLGPIGARFDVISLSECSSTSTLLMEHAREGARSGTVIVADRQAAGRGSRGRSWTSSPEASLTFSIMWSFPGGPERLSGLSLAVGVAIAQGLESCGAAPIALKWPNDVLYENAKLVGILIELYMEEGKTVAVIGIGINLRKLENNGSTHAAALPFAALEQIVPELPERHLLFARQLTSLSETFDRFAAGGFAALREQWQARHAWQDKPVRLLRDNHVEKEGICLGTDTDGALLIRTDEGISRCLSGDVSLRMS